MVQKPWEERSEGREESDMRDIGPIEIEKYLKDVHYPVSKEDLIRRAEEEGADDRVLRTLRELPVDHFNSADDISEAFGKAA